MYAMRVCVFRVHPWLQIPGAAWGNKTVTSSRGVASSIILPRPRNLCNLGCRSTAAPLNAKNYQRHHHSRQGVAGRASPAGAPRPAPARQWPRYVCCAMCAVQSSCEQSRSQLHVLGQPELLRELRHLRAHPLDGPAHAPPRRTPAAATSQHRPAQAVHLRPSLHRSEPIVSALAVSATLQHKDDHTDTAAAAREARPRNPQAFNTSSRCILSPYIQLAKSHSTRNSTAHSAVSDVTHPPTAAAAGQQSYEAAVLRRGGSGAAPCCAEARFW